jgi:hypothetical protein
MFTSVQLNRQNMNLKSKKNSLNAGMALAKGERVIKKFTYKELTIIIGIIVALVIVFAVWANQEVSSESFGSSKKTKIETPLENEFAEKVMAKVLVITLQ